MFTSYDLFWCFFSACSSTEGATVEKVFKVLLPRWLSPYNFLRELLFTPRIVCSDSKTIFLIYFYLFPGEAMIAPSRQIFSARLSSVLKRIPLCSFLSLLLLDIFWHILLPYLPSSRCIIISFQNTLPFDVCFHWKYIICEWQQQNACQTLHFHGNFHWFHSIACDAWIK